jgi:PIN domain nuclease of toxin-antitoxin system
MAGGLTPMVVLDTCALLWWALDPDQLSTPAAEACKQMEQQGGFVSSISIWELGIKVKRGKLDLGMPLQEFVARLKQTSIQFVPVDEAIWMENLNLAWEHNDPADRTIVATAKLRGLPIVTLDKIIKSFYQQVIW